MSRKQKKSNKSLEEYGQMVEKEPSGVIANQRVDNPPHTGRGDYKGIQAPPTRRRRWLRRLLWIFAIFLAVIIFLRVLLWASLPWFLNKAMGEYGLYCTYERLNLSLLTGDAELWHLVLKPTEKDNPLAHVKYCRAEVSLTTLLARRLVVPRIEVDGMDVNIIRATDGTFPQLQHVLKALEAKKSGTIETNTQTKVEPAIHGEIDLTPPIKLDALRLQHVQVNFRDESVSPAIESRLDMNVRLSDLGSAKRQTRFQIMLSSPPVLDQFVVEGTGSSLGMDLLADVKISLNGLHPPSLKAYLGPLGILPEAESIALTCSGQVRTQGIEGTLVEGIDPSTDPIDSPAEGEKKSVPNKLNVHIDLSDIVLTADSVESFFLERVAIDANLPRSDNINLSNIEVAHGRAHVWKRADNTLSVAGVKLSGESKEKNPPGASFPTSTDLSTTDEKTSTLIKDTSTFEWSIGNLSFNDLTLFYHDESTLPKNDLSLLVRTLAVDDAQPQDTLHPGQLTMIADMSIPGVVETIDLTGTIDPSSSQKRAAFKLSSSGICPDSLAPYLESLGLESLYESGELACNIDVVFGPQNDGRINGDVSVTDILLEDKNELFGLKTINLQGVQFDPNSGITRIENVNMSGESLALGRDKNGYFNAFGFRLVDNKSRLQRKESLDSLRPDQPTGGNLRTSRQYADRSGEAERLDTSPIESGQGGQAENTARSMSRIEIGRFSWSDNKVTFIDEAISPVKTIQVPDFGFELNDLILDFGGDPVTPGNLTAWLHAPGIVQEVALKGSVSTRKTGLTLDLDLAGKGLTATEVTPYLEALGIESAITNGALQARLNADLTWTNGNVNYSMTFHDVALEERGKQLARLNHLDVDQLQIQNGGLAVERIELDQPYLTISREQSGLLNLAGICFRPKEESGPSDQPQPTKRVKVSQIRINDCQLDWHDDIVKPAVSQTLIASATLADFALGFDAPPATANITIEMPGIVKKADLSGKLYLKSSEWGADLNLEASGIDTEALGPYFTAGYRPVLKDARFSGELTARLKQHQEGGHQASLSLRNVDYRNDSGQTPLLILNSANASISRFDPNAHMVSIEELSVHGLKIVGERKASDILSLFGFELQSKTSEAKGISNPDDEAISDRSPSTEKLQADATTPTQDQDKIKNGRNRSRQLPLITLASLDLQLEELTFRDHKRPATGPIVFSDFRIRNEQPITLLGEDPDSNPVVNIDITGEIKPLVGFLTLKTELSPFAAQPRIQAELDVEKISVPGLCSVAPELVRAIDPNGLSNGRLSGKAELTLAFDRRDVLDFDLSKPFGLDLLVKDIEFINADSNTPIAGLEELHADIPRVDLTQGSVHVKEIGLTKPQGTVSRNIDGLHVLGLTFKAFAKKDIVDTNSVEVSEAIRTEDTKVSKDDEVMNDPEEPAVRVDQILVNGIDFTFVDRTTDPTMYIPLTGLDVELRDFATRSAKTTKPIRFNAILTAGEVSLNKKNGKQVADSNDLAEVKSAEPRPLPKDSDAMEKRLLFQELTATGRLALYPRLDGWMKAGLSGLELVNFKGTAGQVGVTLNDGILDASVDMRFRGEGAVSTRTQFVFTDLSLTEPPDGFLLQLLSLPTSLDTVLFILQDSDGAIRLPLAFKIDEDGLSRGQMTSAAIGATAALIANAVASSPFRVAGTVGDILGTDEEEEKTELNTYVLQYAPGVTVVSREQLQEFERLLAPLRKEKNVTATIRHQLGGGDIEHADSLVNLSPKDTLDLWFNCKKVGCFIMMRMPVLLLIRNIQYHESRTLYV